MKQPRLLLVAQLFFCVAILVGFAAWCFGQSVRTSVGAGAVALLVIGIVGSPLLHAAWEADQKE